MTQEQEKLLGIFDRVVEFMESEGIRFYLLGGTAIGAVRHNGFIPWDDDIDIMLDIDNYHKLLSKADSLPWDDIELISSELNPDYYRPFARFAYKKDTMFMKSGMFNHGVCMGTLIDVMPLYDVPSSMMDEYIHDFMLYQEVLALPNTYKKDIYKFKEEYFALKAAEHTEGRVSVLKRLRDKVESYAQYDCDRKVVGLWGAKLRDYDAAWFEGEPRYFPFEGRMLPVPHNVEACLRYQYGYDWYVIPQEEDRMTHKFYRDWDISANNYYADMSRFVDWKEADARLDEKKHAQVDMLKSKFEHERYQDQLYAQRLLMEADIRPGELAEVVSRGDYTYAADRARRITDNIKIFKAVSAEDTGLTGSDLQALVTSLIYTGKVSSAVKVNAALGIDDGSSAYDLLERTKKLCEAWQDRAPNGTDAVITSLEAFSGDERDTVPACLIAAAGLAAAGVTGTDESAVSHTEEACRKHLAVNDSNSDVRKALADLLRCTGREEEAAHLYRRVAAESRNGLDLLEIQNMDIIETE